MIDFSKVAPGDKVLIEATVVGVDKDPDAKQPLEVSIEWLAQSRAWPHKDAFVSHIPRGPEVGDEVVCGGYDRNGAYIATVVAIDGEYVWLKWPDGRHFTTALKGETVTKRKSAE